MLLKEEAKQRPWVGCSWARRQRELHGVSVRSQFLIKQQLTCSWLQPVSVGTSSPFPLTSHVNMTPDFKSHLYSQLCGSQPLTDRDP